MSAKIEYYRSKSVEEQLEFAKLQLFISWHTAITEAHGHSDIAIELYRTIPGAVLDTMARNGIRFTYNERKALH